MATVLDKTLKRQISVDGVDYTLAVDTDGIRLTGKGKRRPEVDLRWHDLLSGEAAMVAALNASLSKQPPATVKAKPQAEPDPQRQPARKKPAAD